MLNKNYPKTSQEAKSSVADRRTTFHQIVAFIISSVYLHWERSYLDLFATRWNTQLPAFLSFPDQNPLAVEGLSISWNSMHAKAFPPAILIHKILVKLIQSVNSTLILITSFKLGTSYINMIQSLIFQSDWPAQTTSLQSLSESGITDSSSFNIIVSIVKGII